MNGFILAVLDDDNGISEKAYIALCNMGNIPQEILNKIRYCEGRYYLISNNTQ